MKSYFMLVSCGKRKSNNCCPAMEMYNSDRFQMLKQFAKTYMLNWGIFSAKYALLLPDEIIEPYDISLKDCSMKQKQLLRKKFEVQLQGFEKTKAFMVVADNYYSQFITPILQEHGFKVSSPFYFKEEQDIVRYIKNATMVDQVFRFYSEIKRLMVNTIGDLRFKVCSGTQYWPRRGVYFVLDYSESTLFLDGFPRIVRIGTHAVSKGSKSTLWNRLKTHKGTNDGYGNHRGSIFRLHVGNAIISAQGLYCPSWGHGATATREIKKSELFLEKMVSEYIGNLGVAFLDVDDAPSASSMRAYVEKNVIALLSSLNSSFNFSEMSWLGNFSPRTEIKDSCLWNINYVSSEYDQNFMPVFSSLVDKTIKNYKQKTI